MAGKRFRGSRCGPTPVRMIDRDGIRQRYEALQSFLDERGRRLWASAEAKAAGYGGIAAGAQVTGLAPSTIGRGLKDLADQSPLPPGRLRRPGAGRKPSVETDPQLRPALEALVEPTARGDPEAPLRWTCKSLRRLADELQAQGHRVSRTLVGTLLHDLGFSLGSPDRTGTDSLQADEAGTSGGCQGGQGCRAAPESPETVGVEFAVAGPEVIAGEIDVAPAQGREMGEDGLRHWDTVPTERVQGAAEIDGVPQHDGRGDQREPAGAMLLGFGATIAHAAEAVEAHGAGQRIARFALVQFRSGTPAQLRIAEPVEHQQGALNT